MSARRRGHRCRAAAAALALGFTIPLTTVCIRVAPALADPPPPPDPSVSTTASPVTAALSLEPHEGKPGTTFKATIAGFGACLQPNLNAQSRGSYTMSIQFDQTDLQPANGALADDGSASADLTVPDDAKPGEHNVRVQCSLGQRLVAVATDHFTVPAAGKPALTLDIPTGSRGAHIKASGTGFACGDGTDTVELTWGTDVVPEGSSGTFTAQLTVPQDASVGDHTVTATCRNHPDITDQRHFAVTATVTSSVTNPVTEQPDGLTLQPSNGAAGATVRAVGNRFPCTNEPRTIQLFWDDGTALGNANLDATGHFDTTFTVPDPTDARLHTVSASCPDGSPPVPAGFTVTVPEKVTSVPTTPLGKDSTDTNSPHLLWWVLVLIGVAVAVVAAVANALRPPKPPAVHAVSRLTGSPAVTMHETPAHGEATHALRLETHSAVGTPTIEEVSDDHTRPD